MWDIPYLATPYEPSQWFDVINPFGDRKPLSHKQRMARKAKNKQQKLSRKRNR